MRKAWILSISLLMVLVLLIGMGVGACGGEEVTPPEGEEEEEVPPIGEEEEELVIPTPAEFEVISLDVEPQEVMMGEAVTITAEVENTGGSEGTYNVILTTDGVTVEEKEVVLAIGSSEVITFTLAEDTPGTYEIGVGGLSSPLVVKNEFELKYDDGTADDFIACGREPGNGYLIDFTPTATPFTITKIKIFGNLFGSSEVYENREFTVEIWDKNRRIIWTASYPHTAKFTLNPEWVEIEVPGISVNNSFYIHFFTCSPYYGGITIGFDSSIPNEHSDLTKDWKLSDSWKYFVTPKEKFNWMIRVIGLVEE